MSEPFLGEIRMFAGNFAPRGYAFCDGQLLAISQNDALFALFGTIYGGDGRTTLALPDLRGRIAIHYGDGIGLTNRPIGLRSGQETVTLTEAQLPTHSHPFEASSAPASEARPVGNTVAGNTPIDLYAEPPVPTADMAPTSTTPVGGDQAHTNLQPFLCIHYICALTGVFPSRN